MHGLCHTLWRRSATAHRSLAAACVALLVGATGTAAARPSPHVVNLPTRTGGIRLYTGLQGGKAPSHTQLLAIAHSSSVVVATPAGAKVYGPTLKAANPLISVLVYENGMYSVPTDPSGMPRSWFQHDKSGRLIRSKVNSQNTLMNPRSTQLFRAGGVTYHGWAGYVIHVCLRDQTRYTSGCFLDATGVDALSAGHNANGAVPIDPQTGKPFSYRSYMLMSAAFTARVQAHVRRAVVSNAFAAGNAYFTKSTYLVDRVGSVAGEAEVWMQGGSWQVNVQMLIDNAHVGTGALINFNAKASALEQQREYITASFLIGRGHHQYLQFSDAGHKSFEQLSPLYRMPIGIPLRAYWRLADYFHHGVYRRYYTKGVAVANPGSKTVKFALGGRYKDVSGHVMTSVTLSAHSGIVLVRSR